MLLRFGCQATSRLMDSNTVKAKLAEVSVRVIVEWQPPMKCPHLEQKLMQNVALHLVR